MTTSSEERWWVAAPCRDCPFRRDVRPFLHPARAESIALSAANRYADFDCHKTTGVDDEGDRRGDAESLTCAGFLTMRDRCGERVPEGFAPSPLVYDDPDEMVEACRAEWSRTRGASGGA